MLIENVNVASNSLSYEMPTVVALGYFDGLHMGHMEIIRAACSYAKERDMRLIVQSFSNFPQKNSEQLMSNEIRYNILSSLDDKADVDLVCLEFDDSLRTMSADAFLAEVVKAKFNASAVFCGQDYRFGAKAAGDVDLLQKFCAREGIYLGVFDDICLGDVRISSSLLREKLKEGDIDGYRALTNGVGSVFAGEVASGKRLGRKLGFPTANIRIPRDRVLPRFGVYVGKCALGDKGQEKTYYGVLNIGIRPTVENSTNANLEIHILDFDKDIYGQELTVEILKFLRDERKFGSPQELASTVLLDKKAAQAFVNEYVRNEANKI